MIIGNWALPIFKKACKPKKINSIASSATPTYIITEALPSSVHAVKFASVIIQVGD